MRLGLNKHYNTLIYIYIYINQSYKIDFYIKLIELSNDEFTWLENNIYKIPVTLATYMCFK